MRPAGADLNPQLEGAPVLRDEPSKEAVEGLPCEVRRQALLHPPGRALVACGVLLFLVGRPEPNAHLVAGPH